MASSYVPFDGGTVMDAQATSISALPSLSAEPVTARKRSCSLLESSAANKAPRASTKKRTSRGTPTGSDPDLLPFWSASTSVVSKELWFPTSNALLASEWCSSSRSEKRMRDSWFEARKHVTTTLPCREGEEESCSWRAILDTALEEGSNVSTKRAKKSRKDTPLAPEKAPAGKVRRIRLYPTEEQRMTLRQWFDAARWTYNECLRAVESEGVHRVKKQLRARAVNDVAIKRLDKEWLKETPYDVRDAAMDDLLKAYESSFARQRNDGKSFKLKFRSRKHSKQESIVIHHKHWATGGKYAFLMQIPTSKGEEERLPAKLNYDSRLVLERGTNAYYLCIPMPLEVHRGENQAPEQPKRVIALDPGVRTFITGYDPLGTCIEVGKGDVGYIYRLCRALDRLMSKLNTVHGHSRKRWRIRKAAARLRKRIRCLVDDVHCRLAKYLCESYDVILLPKFETQRMIRRGQRRIRSKTARAMTTWAHYRFRVRLFNKAREYPTCRVLLVSEAYTSKTCGRCGYMHNSLGGSKEFLCPKCGLRAERDLHAARNIFLRYITLHDSSPH